MVTPMKLPAAIAAVAPDGHITPARRRRIIIDMCRRRIRPGTGSSHEFLRRRTAMKFWPDLRLILQNVRWVIVGGVATRAYMPERETRDLDLLVHHLDSDDAVDCLEAAEYIRLSRLAVPGYLFRSPDGVEVDVIFGEYAWIDEALRHPHHDPAGYPVLDLPYLILMKAEASRAQDLGDLSRMLGLASDQELQRIRAIIRQYAPDLSDDIESLIFLGQMEMQAVPDAEDSTGLS